MFLTIVSFVIVLSVLVFVHELGHFFVAKKFGIKSEEFGFGFPPRAIGFQTWREKRFKKISETETLSIDIVESETPQGEPVIEETIYDKIKEIGSMIIERKWRVIYGNRLLSPEEEKYGTVYSVNYIPLGGFVKIKGENGESEADADSFSGRPAWQRFSVLSAGVGMNVILAAVLISLGLMIGMPQALVGLSKQAVVSNQKIQVAEIFKDSPAEKAKLEVGDIMLSINDQTFDREESLQNFVAANENVELAYKIKRGQEEKIFKIKPENQKETGRAGIGVAIVTTGIVKYPWHIAIWEGIKTTAYLVEAVVIAFYDLFKGIILGRGVTVDIGGPIKIAQITGDAARQGWIYVLQLTALLSINLAVINFLPIPALDGGRVLFIIIEKIKRQPVRKELEATMHYVGFILLLILMALVIFRDAFKWWSGS
jgi:regulator of sigma E protease